jgi:predicted DNA-binding transcriptional regulator YafY
VKIDRLLAMTVLLLNRKRISAKELSERFEVSTKTIYRDMEVLNQAGIPVYAHQGTTGGFEIMEHYTISRQFLSLEELRSVLAAVRGVRNVLDDDRRLGNLLEKVQTMLNKSEKEHMERSGNSIVFDFNPWAQAPTVKLKVNQLQQAIEQSRKTKIRYINMNGTESDRTIEPLGLILKGTVWYLHAFCNLRGDFRVFRLSRVYEIDILTECFERRQAPSLESYSWEPEWSNSTIRGVVMTFHPDMKYRVGDTFIPEQMTVLPCGSIRVQGEFAEDEWFYSKLLSFGDKVKVEEPVEMAKELKERVRKILELYKDI